MGICYSQQQEWQAYSKNYRARRRKRKNKAENSIIYEQKTIHEASFNSAVQDSFRQSNHPLVSLFSQNSSIVMGSVTQMNNEEQQALQKSLQTLNTEAQEHHDNQIFSLSNLKSRSFLHTHRVRLPDQCRENQVSCCPYNSSHMVEYDLWKMIATQNQNRYLIYHPFTQRFLNVKKDEIVCSEDKFQWQVKSFGKRRNGGYVKLVCQYGQLCMTSNRALLQNHRKLSICQEKHISHIWELKFGEVVDMNDM